ncbi:MULTISPECIES: flagellar basal body-associated FliL family protein [Nitrospirillum]|uniref:Flagellar FliL protein n=1 Tax=Nitrospirillum amazonense TaxID=28077 RepID=A0A560FKJ8_9PROT|nr:hypothetical protein [Nitrospirillum amazonense]TWB22118.1 flagellar FliL protein [Nitrospirillum amazonense]TWB63758.1 flagellar FliL protein [Nitrospirillum amazonense]
MKKILFLVVALLALIGAGVGGYIFLVHKDGQPKAEEEKKKPVGPPQFVDIGPFVLPVMGDKQIEQNLLLQVQIQVASDEAKDKVKERRYILQNAYIETLYGKLGQQQIKAGQVIDVVAVRRWLIEATPKVMGEGVVDDVLIQAVNQHPAY